MSSQGGTSRLAVGKPELAAAVVAVDDDPFHLRWPAEESRGALRLSPVNQLADPGRRDALEHGHAPDVEAELLEEGEIALPVAPEAERVPRRNDLGAHAAEDELRELRRLEPRERVVEREHDDVVHSGGLEQLEPPLERREQLDFASQHRTRMRVEGHDGRP